MFTPTPEIFAHSKVEFSTSLIRHLAEPGKQSTWKAWEAKVKVMCRDCAPHVNQPPVGSVKSSDPRLPRTYSVWEYVGGEREETTNARLPDSKVTETVLLTGKSASYATDQVAVKV